MTFKKIVTPTKKGAYFVDGIEEKKYHKGKGISRSDILACKDTVPGWLRERLSKEESDDTPAKIFGRAFHTLVLEPHHYKERFTVLPPTINLRLKDDRAFRDDLIEKGHTLLKKDDQDTLNAMAKSYFDHPFVQWINEGATYERAAYWPCKKTGFLQKCKYDIINMEKEIFADVKTVDSPTIQAWEKDIAKWDYDVQDAHYSEGAREVFQFYKAMVFILVSKKAPHPVAVRFLDDGTKATGNEMRRRLLKRIKDFSERETHWDFDVEPMSSGLPAYGHDIDSRIGRY